MKVFQLSGVMDKSSADSSSLSIHDDDGSSSSSTDIEDLINPSSSKFSPQLALLCASSSISVPCPEAPRYLNVFELEKAVPDPRNEPIFASVLEASKAKIAKMKAQMAQKKVQTASQNSSSKVNDKSKPSTSAAASMSSSSSTSKQVPEEKSGSQTQKPETPFYPMPGRKFLAHQMPVFRPHKEQPNVIIEMKTVKGPLGKIKRVMESRQRIKIWTRNNDGIRGFCTGIVQVFDKHWNLILLDVYEIFQRKRPDKREVAIIRDQKKQQVNSMSSSSSRHRPDHVSKHQSDKSLKNTKDECILIEGPDALVTLRLHLDALTQHVNCSSGDLCNRDLIQKRTKSVSKPEGPVTKAQLRKKHLSIFPEPRRDPFGFLVLAQSQHYEIVQRRQKQLFLMGNDIAFIESNLS